MPTEPNAARFAGVSGTRISVPSSDPAFSGLARPMMTARQSRSSCSGPGRAQHDVLQFLQRLRAERVPPVPARPLRRRHPGPRPRHQGQVPGQRDDHLPDVRVRHQGHQHDDADHERPGQQPFPLPLHELLPQHRPLRDPVDHARPGLAPPATPPTARASRAQPGCPAPAPARPAGPAPARPPRPSGTPTGSPVRICSVPPIDQRRPVTRRPAACRSAAATPGPPAAPPPSAPRRPEPPRHPRCCWQNATRQGTKTQEAPVMKGDLGNPSSSRSLARLTGNPAQQAAQPGKITQRDQKTMRSRITSP